MAMRTIEVDFHVHKMIEVERASFEETPNDVLRRLLRIEQTSAQTQPVSVNEGRKWFGKGVWLPHGTKLMMKYNGVQHSAQIHDGRWVADGASYDGPSAAAHGVAKTREGSRTNLNGWIYWHAKLPGSDEWVPINSLRRKSVS